MPLTLVHHKKDDCFFTPYSGAAELVAKVARFDLVTIDPEGSLASGGCGTSNGTHNLLGQEAAVADAIAVVAKKAISR